MDFKHPSKMYHDEAEGEQPIGHLPNLATRHRARQTILPWFIAGCLFIALIGSHIDKVWAWPRDDGMRGVWKVNEFETAKRELSPSLHTVRFDASLKYNESRMLYRPYHPFPDFVGTPSKEIDRAWDELTGAVTVFVSPNEAKLFPGVDLWVDPATGLHQAHVTVMHDLHCLNLIRKSRNLDYYKEEIHYTLEPHVQHCIDSLRQSIMCAGDMTLMPYVFSKNANGPMPFFKTVHTCRDYDALRVWSRDRDAKNPQNAERFKASGTF